MDEGLRVPNGGEAGAAADEALEGERQQGSDLLERDWVGLAGSPDLLSHAGARNTPLQWQWLAQGQTDPLARQ